MKSLTLFYDARCGLCCGFRAWLEGQPARVAVEFLPYDSEEAGRRFPGLRQVGADREVVVLADDGRWWQGSSAWLVCLWATREYRDWSYRLAIPALRPFIGKAVRLLSQHRLSLSRLLRLRGDEALASALQELPDVSCGTEACRVSTREASTP